jgi:TolB-like protein
MAHAEAAASTGGLNVSPTAEAIREQLGRIQGSSDFDVPERAHRFLGYVIEETLSGRADRIKAYSIALEVFGRDSSFDAQADPVVRIEAGRVRRALERYYLTAGKSDAILITIPKGGYVPQFEQRLLIEESSPPPAAVPQEPAAWWLKLPRWTPSAAIAATALVVVVPLALISFDRKAAQPIPTPHAAQPDIPRLLIEPFEDLSKSESSAILARGMTEEVIGQIAKFKDLQIVEIPVGTTITSINAQTPARYALLGSVRVAGDSLRITARLRKIDDNAILWAQSYDEDLKVQGILAVQADIARQVTTALAQPFGVIFQADSARVTQLPPNDWEAYNCTLSYYTYRQSMDWGAHANSQACLERTVERYPGYASAWALLSMIYLDDFRFRFPKTAPPPLDKALEAAKRAVDLDARNARAQQALMLALFFNGEVPAALRVGAQAVEFNPNDTDLLAEYGVRLGHSGNWYEGRTFLEKSLERNPIPPTYYDADLAVNFYMVKDYATAEVWIEKTEFGSNPLYHLVAAMIYGQLGRVAESRRERDWLLSNAPDLIKNIRRDMANRLGRPADQEHAIDGLILAGLPIPRT